MNRIKDELIFVSGKEFIQIAGCASNRVFNFLSRRGVTGQQSIVRMRGLPFSTKPSEIRNFFESGECGEFIVVSLVGGGRGVSMK